MAKTGRTKIIPSECRTRSQDSEKPYYPFGSEHSKIPAHH